MRWGLALAWTAAMAVSVRQAAIRARVARRARNLTGEEAGVRMRGQVRGRRQRRELAALEAEVPLAADLLAVALGAGSTPYLALRIAAGSGPPRTAERFRRVLDATASERLVDALAAGAADAPPLRALLEVLIASERDGAPVGPALARLAGERRAQGRRVALARARTVPVRLLFPLVFLVLPAFLLLGVAPVLLAGPAR